MNNDFLKPLILKEDDPRLAELMAKYNVVDDLAEQAKELHLVQNPSLLSDPSRNIEKKSFESVWVFYPWKSVLVHCLNEQDFKYLRTSRNQNLINKKEQGMVDKARIAVAGLNVGNPGAVCLALESDIEMKLADNDILSLSNLNRFRSGLPDLGINKAVLTARQVYEINPFARLEVFEKGITPENIDRFLNDPAIDVLVEEMDNLPLKIKIRELAKESRIPVVMVTGSGPDVIIDVERFDIDPSLPLLSSYLKEEVIKEINAGPTTFEEKIRLARDFMGAEYLHPRLDASFDLVGKELAGIPQIAESSFLRGGAIAYFVRQIIQGDELKSGRYNLKLSDVK